jgi:hypothetical protein
MLNKFEKIIKSLKDIRLSQAEDARMRETLQEYTKHFPVEQNQNSRAIKSPYLMWWRLVPATIIVALIIVGNTDYDISNNTNIPVSDKPVRITADSKRDESGFTVPALEDTPFENKSSGLTAPYYPDTYYSPTSDITDTREFLKINYSSKVQTKDVSNTVRDINFLVKDLDGRIDDVYISEKRGHVSFVIPKSNFFEFRSRVEEIVGAKLYIENTSSTNLLYQKQNIEKQLEESESLLDKLKRDKKILDEAHTERIQSIQSRMISLETRIVELRELEANTTVPGDLERIRREIDILVQQLSALEAELDQENLNYNRESRNLDNRINQTKVNIDNLEEADTALINNVETVNGYIDVEWINLLKFLDALSPTPMWLNFSVLILFMWWFIERKKYIINRF